MTPELYKRWRLGLGFVTAKDLADHLEMAAISISTYESRGSGPSADDKLLRILEKKILDRDDEFINTVIDTDMKFGILKTSDINNQLPAVEAKESAILETNKSLEQRLAELEARVEQLESTCNPHH